MNVNEKGALGLVHVIKDLVAKGFEVFLPIHDYSTIDLIAVKESTISRIQVKYRAVGKNGVVPLTFYSVVNGKHVAIDRTMIDVWAVYVPDVDVVLYIPPERVIDHKAQFSVRVIPGDRRWATSPIYTEFLEW